MWSEPTPAVIHNLRFFACTVDPRTRQFGEFSNQILLGVGQMTHPFDEVTSKIARMERSGDQHLGLKSRSRGPLTVRRHGSTYIYHVLLEVTIRTLFGARHLTIDRLMRKYNRVVWSHDELVAQALQVRPQTELFWVH
jgi:hypothetical protein